MNILKKSKKAFTLIEAAIVLFIISLLMLLILPNLNVQRKHAVENHATAMVSTVQTQIDLYQNDHPNQDNVTLAALKSENYLTEKQFQKAQDLKITIVHNEARK
ncbi:competence type IV pilus major pilin ComGC [Leuconostoc mesenteroides]|uniref:competence type IV pilus major pilin ComGC n=1 Tax=Leuconostoc mesenteroides TaxID=1245 RepID=UPI00107F3235|nr:competence type IV pilus major pilin ComGC [Leuconostoc mesenteroides]QXC54408.1 competence protein ComGC [Leuconostoc mesenteroides]TGD35643.1 competence protein ComGC [Leuconostoc mesenteroides]USI46232.1 prepilin-type N-terminal cleavage/methylation domain-containing protein [Leuconostoc mesenteroides]